MSLFAPSTETLNVTLLLLPDASMMSLASVLDVMRAANRFRLSQQLVFRWQLATYDGQPARLSCGLLITPDTAFTTDLKGDALILLGGFNQAIHVDRGRLLHLQKVMPRFKVIGGVESGGWLLARAGKLDGRKATVHWEDLEDFALCFPTVNVQPDRYVLDENIFTTGGASPSFDFMLHWIRKRYGYQLALDIASAFIYDGVHQGTDAQPTVSLGLLEQYEPRVSQAIRIMEQYIDAPLPLPEIAARMSLSVRMLEHLFSRHLQTPPGRYYLYLRLKTAHRLVLDTRLSMQEIAVRCGFGSLAVFSRQFKKLYQQSPSFLRKQHHPFF